MGNFEFRYIVTIHVAAGVTISYETNDNIDFKKVLKKKRDVLLIEGSPNTQAIPVRSILVVQVTDKEAQPAPVTPEPVEERFEIVPEKKKPNKKKKRNGAKK